MSTLAMWLATVAFVVGVVSLVRPIPRVGIASRRHALWVVIGSVILAAIAAPDPPSGAATSAPPPAPATQEPAVPANAGVGQTAPTSPEAQIRQAIAEQYRKPVDVQVTGRRVLVTFDVAENLTLGMSRRGAQIDVKSILEGVDDSGFDFESVFIHGMAPLVDRFGHKSRDTVINVGYDRATVDRINWENMLTDNIYVVADSAVIHPQFQPE